MGARAQAEEGSVTMHHLGAPREMRRLAVKLEREALRTGNWGPWEHTPLPNGFPSTGWSAQVRLTSKNRLYAVLDRPVETEWGTIHHLAIRTASNLEPPWRDKQRIKNELYGPEFTAVEVMPPRDELIDEADMYHIWVLPPAFSLPFTLCNGGAR
jgi:hypothetical protein